MRRTPTPEGEQALEQAVAWHQVVQDREGSLDEALAQRRSYELAANVGGITIDRIKDRLACARSIVIEDLARAREEAASRK